MDTEKHKTQYHTLYTECLKILRQTEKSARGYLCYFLSKKDNMDNKDTCKS